ncbi:MAG: polysaccharide deacetylase family protein [Rhizobiales bacterium]|nr:polysaccharide deacetylase family protein [Hyphomicrobiales bacterium]
MRFVAFVLRIVALVFCGMVAGLAPAIAATCPGNPHAIGTSRTVDVDPSALPRIGKMQYRNTLPLNDHEVVITFDDGPLPPYTDRILETLAFECVKATYFLVGQMARAYPDAVRRIYNAGHVIGTHSQNHPLTFDQMALPRIESEVDGGIASVKAAVGDARAVAPFFRIPGLLRSSQVENYLASQSLAVWSADEVADDWFKSVTPEQIVRKAMRRIEARDHRGVLLLHDIHPATALALPALLRELKENGYRIVQAVPTGVRPKSVPELPAPSLANNAGGWPRLVKTGADKTDKSTPYRPSSKRLARGEREKESRQSHRGKRYAFNHGKHESRMTRHRKRLARLEREAEIEALVAKKKRKAQTAEQD